MIDKNPSLDECRGDHTEAMLRYEEFLVYIAKHPKDIISLKDAIHDLIVNCPECDGSGDIYCDDGEYLEEYPCRSCDGKYKNIIEEYNL